MDCKVLVLSFENRLLLKEVPLFRGAIVKLVGRDYSELLHNHGESGVKFVYPMVQYKQIDGKAAIVGVNDGIDVLLDLVKCNSFALRIGTRKEVFNVEAFKPNSFEMRIDDEMHAYLLRSWLPFNQQNYALYEETKSLVDRIRLLEQILTGNILSFCKGVGVSVEETITCSISDLDRPQRIMHKGVYMLSFNVEFCTNMLLPSAIGLGKGVSMGFGVLDSVSHPTQATQ